MKDRGLLKEIGKLGFNLFEKEEPIDANKILYDVIKSREIRLLEGFPVMLISAMKSERFDCGKLISRFKNIKDKSICISLIELSLAVYEHQQLKFKWGNVLLSKLSEEEKKKSDMFLIYLRKNKTFNISNYQFRPERIKHIFLNYYKKEERKRKTIYKKQEELSLEYALSQIFSKKQKSLFKKKLSGEVMTKTEKEYFSRTVKKKIIALSNTEVHNMARKILEQR